jgi:hypothetical protein
LNDQATLDVQASLTTIDFRIDGSKAASIDLGHVIPGDIAYAPVALSNSGTGYIRIHTTTAISATPLGDATKVTFFPNVASTSNCNAAGVGTINWTNAQSASDPLFTGEIQIDATATQYACVVYKFGNSGDHFAGSTIFNPFYTIAGYYP